MIWSNYLNATSCLVKETVSYCEMRSGGRIMPLKRNVWRKDTLVNSYN